MNADEKMKDGGSWIRGSINLKLFAVGMLSLMLLIPAAFVGALIDERASRREGAIQEVGGKWGEAQTVTGPVLHVPYKRFWKDDKGQMQSSLELAYFLPGSFDVDGSVSTELRRRGIYEVVLYKAKLKCSGLFAVNRIDDPSIAPENVLWDKAFVTLGVTDMRGVEERVQLDWDGQHLDFEPGTGGSGVVGNGIHRKVPVKDGDARMIPYAFELTLRGHDDLMFVPVAGKTTVSLKSPWQSPSYMGAFLPHRHATNASGFVASWSVLDLNRGFPQHWTGQGQSIAGSDFGVRLLCPVDSYLKSSRAHKYALLFISMTFLSLFFIEILKKERVHVLNYILVGLAICLFYVILLSLSEHIGFDPAYGIATIATTCLVTWHASNVLVQRRLCRAVGGVLMGLYAFMYILLQLEDFALLVGTVGLFVILTVVMSAASRITREQAV